MHSRTPFNLKERCQLFVRSHDVAFAIVAVSINNKNPAFLATDDGNASPTPTGLAQTIRDDFPIFPFQIDR
jgi:hypothetical protein